MKRIPTRMRVLGILAIAAGLFWVVDRFTAGGPQTAAGATASSAPPVPVADWEETTALILRLTTDTYAPVEPELAALRDLFAEAEVSAGAPELDVAVEDVVAVPETDPVVEFQAAHRLVAVMLGQRPLAVIDERVMPLHAEVDGFQLVQVARDFVVLRRADTGAQVRLELQPRPRNSARGAP